MRRLPALFLVVTLTACAQPDPMGAPETEAAVVVQEDPLAAPDATRCAPGEGDGIGGTGCAID